jgi:lysozyme
MIDERDEELLTATRLHEGFRPKPYLDTEGRLTVGYGYNLDAGMTKAEAHALMCTKYQAVIRGLRDRYEWYSKLTPNRQRALAEMAYQLGINGVSKFSKMIAACRLGKWETAAHEMLDSKWARQTPVRAAHCAKLMLEG